MVCEEYLLKICMIGPMETRKTSLIRLFAGGKFETDYLPTLGVDITTKVIKIDNKTIKLILVDTAGQEFFGKLRPSYYRGASACMIFAKLIDPLSLESVQDWLAEFRYHVPDLSIPIMIIGVYEKKEKTILNKIYENSKTEKPLDRHPKTLFKIISLLREFINSFLRKMGKKQKTNKKIDIDINNKSSFTKENDKDLFWKKGAILANKLGVYYSEVEMSDKKAFTQCVITLVGQSLSQTS